ncbi:MAG: chromosome segregation protein SMC [Opitutus sp.]|nr:chromosome segregation protein SMC [Opitutus sp.]MCS6246294.1 chromosome segregation protein SMC [Opitutus sp.]MCS6273080.1 chromosome segregation protein SMC [Opitutus sp.]MCS6277909.1 chromosome segregation protein SMC [Opitutus sp.]MCS6298984.1 chromosome segregation protein SMC [Opitutus sp.]
MYLKALKLHGFKSFADPSTLRFEPGVTAIVGPNGCGKSNVADAIRWVLGEQSAKALRGGKMQDVIFEGADTRKPAQMCEVSLLLTDCEKQLGSEFHEIEIMRRVHRDGQGEYFFNGQPCRLKDIQKLFMDTGIGRTSYSIMAQGQIDQILSSKPEERRAVFEEAAGITKYKSQRKEALSKLTLTDANLVRVADVVTEIARQIGSLRRQATKALRYKKLIWRLRHLALAHHGCNYAQVSTTLAHLEEQVIQLRAAAETRRTHLHQQQSALEGQKARRTQLNQRVQEAQQAVFDLRSEKEQAENAANLSMIKRSGLSDRLEASRANLGELDMQLHELSSQVDTGAQDKQMQLALLGGSDAVFQDRNRELAVVEAEATKLEQELQQTKFQILQFESNVARLRTDCSSYEVDQKTSAHRHESVANELESLRQQQSSAAQQLSELSARVEEATVAKARAHQEAQDVQIQIGDLTREFRDGQKKLQDIDRQLAQRTARLNLLKQLAEKFEGFGEGAKAILQGRLAPALGESKATPITHGLEIQPVHAKAVEALLGSAVEAINVADVGTAQKILAQLEVEQIGAAVLQISTLKSEISNVTALPPGLTPATAALVNYDPAHPATALLGACYVAENLHAFLDFWRDNPTFQFLAVATAKGEVVDRRGLIFGGFAKKSNNSIVQREIDMRETARLLADDQLAHDSQKAVIESLSTRLAEAESTLEEKRAEVLEASQNVATVQSEERNAQRSLDELGTKANRMESELQGLEAQRNETQTRFERARTALTDANAAVEAGRARINEMETRLTELRADRDMKRENLGQARLDLADCRQKVEVLDRGIADMERRRNQLSAILVQRQQEVEVWTDQIASLEVESGNQKSRAAQIAETLVVAQQQVEHIRIELGDVEREIGGVENSQDGIRTDAEKAQADFSRCEVALAQNKSRAQFLEEDVQREFQIRVGQYDWRAILWRSEDDPPDLKMLDLDDDEDEDAEPAAKSSELRAVSLESKALSIQSVPSGPEGEVSATPSDQPSSDSAPASAEAAPVKRRKKKGPKPDPTEDDLVALEKSADWSSIKVEVDALRQRLASMGAVNTGAIEEYAELKQRYDFLKGQSDDLNNAKADLIKTIDEINQTSMTQFQITFDQIKKNFVYTFQTLFGGGIANLELVMTDDILESGIEITAQPPGTKLKGITLLSGGQKTLTAVALLFALYMVKPSPFCLLDELDAPLDESNIGRFTNLLGKFVDNSQFIIITHNKRTVSAAQAIYGVTMEERGVSKTVSMKFSANKGDLETHQENIAESVRGAKSTIGG